MDCSDATKDIEFNPPLYIQRYNRVCELLKNSEVPDGIESVVDLGCAECTLLTQLKMVDGLRTIAGVDIDGTILESCKQRVAPLNYDYIVRRQDPLTISLYRGSVAEVDARFKGYEAVTCIELIEHLLPDILSKLPYTIFAHIQPKIAIFSTPNVEFNVLFTMSNTFRHWDHKFEWTRDEFRTWCENIIEQYPNYRYWLSGVGEGPQGSEHLGYCTQMAIFIRQKYNEYNDKTTHETPYELIVKYDYPYEEVKKSRKALLLLEAEYYIRMLAKSAEDDEDYADLDDSSHVVIPLQKLLVFNKLQKHCDNESELKQVLEEAGWTVFAYREGFAVIPKDENREDSDDSC